MAIVLRYQYSERSLSNECAGTIYHRTDQALYPSKNPNAEVIVFGSHTRGEATTNSDWEILTLLNAVMQAGKWEKNKGKNCLNWTRKLGSQFRLCFFRKATGTSHMLLPLFYANVKRDRILLSRLIQGMIMSIIEYLNRKRYLPKEMNQQMMIHLFSRFEYASTT
ncbi:MAG: nucleotidyltransferase domain-containing protein [Mangrovibacterium sp.]